MDGILTRLCRYMTDVNGRGETWHFYRDREDVLNLVADFPLGENETDDDEKRITGYIITAGITEDDIIRNLFNGQAGHWGGSDFDVPVLNGLTADSSVEELSLRLAVFGY